jgi:aminoglycoside phosphotransferase (APT) family kinase protein
LLATWPDPPTICVTALPGTTLAETSLAADQERSAYEHAGRLLAAYHAAAPVKIDPAHPSHLADRARHWIQATDHLLDDTSRAAAYAHAEAIARLPITALTPCHLDFTPGNILVSDHGRVGIIDFEHSHYDHPARDLVRMATRIWPTRPDLEVAFLAGYGELSQTDRELIRRYATTDKLSRYVIRTA